MERPARYRRGDRALEPVLADRRDAEHPIVDADVGEHHGALLTGSSRHSGRPNVRTDDDSLTIASADSAGKLPIIGVSPAPMDLIRAAGTRNGAPPHSGVGTHGTFDFNEWRRRSTRDPRKRGNVKLGHLREISEINMIDGVAVADALLGPKILVLPVVILDRDADPRRRETHLQERNMVAAALEPVSPPDLPNVEADLQPVREAVEV